MPEYSRPTAESLVRTYIQAKDENRPHLMTRVFAADAVLEMVVNTGAISFPAVSTGVEAIADTLSRKFGQTYENVYTFCLQRPDAHVRGGHFSCDWLVGMSEKESGNVRVGCGRYDWHFQAQAPFLVERLKITIDEMQILPAHRLQEVIDWVDSLPRHWCDSRTAIDTAPCIDALAPVLDYIARNR
ncbi:hypothetical protein D3870_04110 [Noviherbaspirillum cavernae]|uniref:Uncharacterized protein n=1 Tax=Noviherbaspirillum cavernae TaxID=2320862 RepID=A0A418WYI3_9BURK|nr:nuclear transport factor 2 family protein [Noviherbaspirillum cavernae]RJG05308.1 hypothetical protein D3870_04110 [Noviherbaspirillum cavernae]